jgi:hypothetical protein
MCAECDHSNHEEDEILFGAGKSKLLFQAK